MSGFSLQFEQFPLELSHVKSSGNSLLAHLELVFKYANYAVESRNWRGEALYLPQLDQAIIDLTKHSELPRLNTAGTENLSDCYVVLVTEVYVTGGHGRVMNRMVEELPSHVIFTDLFGRLTSGTLKLAGLVSDKSLSCAIVYGDDLERKLRSLLTLLDSIKPKALILLGHHQDVVVQMAGAIYCGGNRTAYFHHCDHEPALGALIRYPVHIDTIEEITTICSGQGLSTRVWPMSVPASSSIKNGIVGLGRIATCGSSVKFEGCFNDIYYRDIVKEVLQCKPDISLYHVGPLQEAFITDIRHFLENSGIDPSRFLYVGPVSDLRQFLIINEIDLYLQSFPAGGGTTAVEVQSMGVPVIYANPDFWNASLIGSRSLYASQELEWNSLSEISRIIRESLSSDVWKELSRVAIEKYNSCFHPDRGADFFEALEAVFS